ncbi:MAG: hypothetical protein ABSB11_08840 [Sedimentisphaerales bacterium]|jgi:hypothetical protein
MKFYWSINSIPELAGLPKQNRKKAWRKTHLKYFFKVGVISTVLDVFFIVVGCLFGQIYYGFGGGLIGIVIAGGIGGTIAWELEANLIRPCLREYLNSNVKAN